MKIRELLNLMNASNRFTSNNHKIEIFSDGSGGVYDDFTNLIIEFENENSMQEVLNAINKKIEKEKIKFEL